MPAAHVLLEPHYFPNTCYWAALARAAYACLEVQGRYVRQTYQSRCCILTAQGMHRLVVPVRQATTKGPYHQVAIDYREDWPKRHLRTLATAYGRAPYFAHYFPQVEALLLPRPTYLLELQLSTLQRCSQWLGLCTHLTCTTTYQAAAGADTIDLRGAFHPRRALPEASMPRYLHAFDQPFHPVLSILDLLMCEGPEARQYLA